MYTKEKTLLADVGDRKSWPNTMGYPSIYKPSGNWISGDRESMCRYYHEMMGVYRTYTLNSGWGNAGNQVFSSTERPRPIFNDCVNVKSRCANYPYTALSGSANRLKIYPYYRDLASYAQADVPSTTRIQPLFASNRGWYHLQPRFEGEIQMLNALFELKDFKDMAKSLGKLKPHRFLTSYQRIRKGVPRVDPSSATAGAWLFNAMALQPMIKDYAGILMNTKQLADEALTEFKAKGHDLQSRHYTEVLDEGGSYNVSYAGQYYGWLSRTTFTSTLQYKYGYRSVMSDKAIFEKYWGLEWTPSVVHNMVPFTFLLDYFIGLSSALKAVELDKNLLLEPFQYCESTLKKETSGRWIGAEAVFPNATLVGYGQTPEGEATFMPAVGSLISGYENSVFVRERKPWPRRGLYIPKLSLPNNRQGLNMLALARVFL